MDRTEWQCARKEMAVGPKRQHLELFLRFFIALSPYPIGIIIPINEMRKPRPRKAKPFTCGGRRLVRRALV